MITDPIADMLTRIRNAQAVGKQIVDIPYSRIKHQIALILEKQGFIDGIEKRFKKNKKTLRVILKYKNGQPAILGMKRISKPGRRFYAPCKKIRPPKGGYGVAIISTSSGLMVNSEARKRHLGGEIVCEVW